MALLRLATDAVKRIPLVSPEADGSTDEYIEVRADISKRTFNKLVAIMPDVAEGETLTIEQGLAFQKDLFETFVVGWSLDAPASVETYLDLEKGAADAVDAAIGSHFEAMNPSKDESTKSA